MHEDGASLACDLKAVRPLIEHLFCCVLRAHHPSVQPNQISANKPDIRVLAAPAHEPRKNTERILYVDLPILTIWTISHFYLLSTRTA
jgi:hypothetical protein